MYLGFILQRLSLYINGLCLPSPSPPSLPVDECGRCKGAEPTQGELWTSISKTTDNRRLGKADIMKKVVAAYFADGALIALPGGPPLASSGS